MAIEDTLKERQAIHGNFLTDANISQALKEILRNDNEDKWVNDMTTVQREALELICTKLGRIIAGDHNHKDHWLDIAGYATLVSQRLD